MSGNPHDSQAKMAEEINSEMADLMSAKSEELVRLLKLTEDTSRRVVASELDIRRQRELQARLDLDLSNLESKLEEGQNVANALSKQKEELTEKNGKLVKNVDDLRKDTGRLNTDVDALGKELKDLQNELELLEKRKSKLNEDIARLKKLRQEYLGTISKLRAEKDELTS
jgi:chromosome segregation ATPase